MDKFIDFSKLKVMLDVAELCYHETDSQRCICCNDYDNSCSQSTTRMQHARFILSNACICYLMSEFGCEQELETYFSKFDCMVDDIPKLPTNISKYLVESNIQ